MPKKFVIPKVMLAPLSGITDLPFREIARLQGCKFAFIEMLCARSLSHHSKKTLLMTKSSSLDRPLGLQLLGNDETYILKAIDSLRDLSFDVLDLNAACPHKKIIRCGKGAALLNEPQKLKKILLAMKKAVKVPVTVKVRLGFEHSKDSAAIAKHCQDSGVDALCVHGRTRKQGYSGVVDYTAIANIKKSLSIPVIASGDIWTAFHAKKMFDETGCDAIMVARGSLGNPWIFKEIESLLTQGKVLERPEKAEIARVMEEHLKRNVDVFEERIGVIRFRKLFIWYVKGYSNTKELRMKVSMAKTRKEMLALCHRFLQEAKKS